jgi:hypothetical protein
LNVSRLLTKQRADSQAAALFQPLLQPLHQAWQRWRAKAKGHHTLHTLYLGSDGVLSWPSATGSTAQLKPSAFADFGAWCAAHPQSDARIFVSGHLLHSLVVDPAVKLLDDAALRAYAQQQFGHYHGPAAKQWPLAIWSQQRKTHSQAGACALHGVDMTALHAAAHAHGVRLRSVSPVWSAGLSSVTSHWPAQDRKASRHAVALIEGHMLTWLLLQNGTVVALEQRYLDAPEWPAVSRLVAQLSTDNGPLSAPPAMVAWGLSPMESSPLNTSADPAPLRPAHDPRSTIGAWVLDAVSAAHMVRAT